MLVRPIKLLFFAKIAKCPHKYNQQDQYVYLFSRSSQYSLKFGCLVVIPMIFASKQIKTICRTVFIVRVRPRKNVVHSSRYVFSNFYEKNLSKAFFLPGKIQKLFFFEFSSFSSIPIQHFPIIGILNLSGLCGHFSIFRIKKHGNETDKRPSQSHRSIPFILFIYTPLFPI